MVRIDIDNQAPGTNVSEFSFRIEEIVLFSGTAPPVKKHDDCDVDGGTVLASGPDIPVKLDLTTAGRTTIGDFAVAAGPITEIRLFIEDPDAVRKGHKQDVSDASSCELEEHDTHHHHSFFHRSHKEHLNVLRLVPDRPTSTFAGRLVEVTALFDPNRDLTFINHDGDNDRDDHNLAVGSSFTVRSLPIILSFTPTSGAPGDTVHITGQGFDEPGLQVLFTSAVPATISSSTDTNIDVVVPVGAVLGPLTVKNSLGTATWVTPFVPTSLGGPLSPGDLVSCAELAGTAVFGTAVNQHRVAVLQENNLPMGASPNRVCKISLFDYTANAYLDAVIDLSTSSLVSSRSITNAQVPIGITEEADARSVAEVGTLATTLTANPGFEHVGLVRGETGTCSTHRCVEVVYQKHGGIQTSNNAPEPAGGTFTFLQLSPIARTVVDMTTKTVLTLEVF
jgi:hypothetical protein